MSAIGDRIRQVQAAVARGLPSIGDLARLASGDGTKALMGDGTFRAPSAGGGGPRYLPFFGDTAALWTRPALAIGGATSKFHAWLNQGGSTATDPSGSANHTADPTAQPLILSAVSDTDLVALLTDLSVSPPYTITALLALPTSGAADNSGPACIVLYDNVNDQAVAMEWYAQPGNSFTPTSIIKVGKFIGTTVAASYSASFGVLPQYLLWLRINNDGTNLNYSISYENLRYIQILTQTLVSIGFSSFNQVGIGFDPDPNNISATASDIVDWYFEVTSS